MSFINFTYLVIDQKTQRTAIVDPAWELGPITAKFEELGIIPTTILLTHSHLDHVNLVQPLVKRYNSQVFMSLSEMHYYNYQCLNLNPFSHRQRLMLGDTEITCLITPGHTYGSACYLCGANLFTGDTIFIEGCGICNTYGGSPEMMFASFQEVKKTINPETKVFPGHSYGKAPGYSLDYLLKENIYFQLDSMETFVDFRMREKQKGLFNFK